MKMKYRGYLSREVVFRFTYNYTGFERDNTRVIIHKIILNPEFDVVSLEVERLMWIILIFYYNPWIMSVMCGL